MNYDAAAFIINIVIGLKINIIVIYIHNIPTYNITYLM